MAEIWFTSDSHYGHSNVIGYCKRPFSSVGEMNQALIDNCNALVKPEDTLWHLGDFCYGIPDARRDPYSVAKVFRDQIHCKDVRMICGNHDHVGIAGLFREFHGDYRNAVAHEIKIDSQRIVLSHYAMRTWNHQGKGVYCLYGHSHGSLPDDPHSLSFDCGVDCWGYKPINFEQVKEAMAVKTPLRVDHH